VAVVGGGLVEVGGGERRCGGGVDRVGGQGRKRGERGTGSALDIRIKVLLLWLPNHDVVIATTVVCQEVCRVISHFRCRC